MTNYKYINKLLIIPVLSVALLLSGCGDDLTDVEYVQRAKDFQDEGDLVSAVLELKNAAIINPENPEARLLLGEIYLLIGDGSSAEKELMRAGELGVTGNKLNLLIARSFLLVGKLNEVEKWLDFDSDSNDYEKSGATLLRGKVKLLERKLDEAEKLFLLSNKFTPNFEAFIELAKVSLYNSDIKNARKNLDEARDLAGENNTVFIIMSGELYKLQGKNDLALNMFDKAIEIQPNNLIALIHRTELYIQIGDFKRADDDLAVLLREYPNVLAVDFLAANFEIEKGDFRAAKVFIDKIFTKNPVHRQTQRLAGIVSFELKEYRQAQYHLLKLIGDETFDRRARDVLAATLIYLEEPDEAINLIVSESGAEALTPNNIVLLANAYLLKGDTNKSKELFEKAVTLGVGGEKIENQLVTLQLISGELDGAMVRMKAIDQKTNKNIKNETLLFLGYLVKENYEKAREFITNKLEDGNTSKKEFYYQFLGILERTQSNVEAAEHAYIKSLDVNEEFIPALLGLASVNIQKGNKEKAKTFYEKIIRIAPEYVDAILAVSVLESDLGHTKRAVELLEGALESDKNNKKVVRLLSNLYAKDNRLDKALNIVKSYGLSHPDELGMQKLYSEFLISGNSLDKAENHLRWLVEGNVDDIYARLLLAKVLLKQKKYDLSLAHVDKVLLQDASNNTALGYKASNLISLNKIQDAEKVIAQMSELDSGSLLELRARLLAGKKDWKGASDLYALVYKRSQNNAEIALSLAYSLFLSGQKSQAISFLKKYVDSSPNNLVVRSLLAEFYSSNKNPHSAIEQYEYMLSKNDEDPVVLNNLASLYGVTGNPQGLNLASKAFLLEPDNEVIADTYGWLLVQNGENVKALPILTKAFNSSDSNNLDLNYHYAVALFKNGRFFDSKNILSSITTRSESSKYEWFSEANELLADIKDR